MIITLLYAGLLGLLLVLLSARVILARGSTEIRLGHGGNAMLERRIRAQGNLTEYGPIALILLAALELSGSSAIALHGLGIVLVIGRLLHGWALSFSAHSPLCRIAGMILTLTVIGIAALWAIAHSVGSQFGG